MDAHLVLGFWAVAFALIAVPGPDWAFVLASGARDRVVLPAVAGLMIGYSGLTAVVAIGLGSLVAHSSPMLTALTAVGAGYLSWLGGSLLRHPVAVPLADASSARSGARLVRGIGVSGLNPKGVLIFLALLPQFTDSAGNWPMPAQLAVLGAVFVATCGAFYTAVGFGARVVLATRPGAVRAMSRMSGAAMIAVGLVLVAERVTAVVG